MNDIEKAKEILLSIEKCQHNTDQDHECNCLEIIQQALKQAKEQGRANF